MRERQTDRTETGRERERLGEKERDWGRKRETGRGERLLETKKGREIEMGNRLLEKHRESDS